RGISAPVVRVQDMDPSWTFDAALAFRIDRLANGAGLLDAAERASSLVAASFGEASTDETATVSGRQVGERAKSGVVLDLHDDDGTALVVYRGDRPLARADLSAGRRLREGMARAASRRLGRRRPWVPKVRPATDALA